MYSYYIVMQPQTFIINQNININSNTNTSIDRNYNGMVQKSIIFASFYDDIVYSFNFLINILKKIFCLVKKTIFQNKKKFRKSCSNFALNNYEKDNLSEQNIEHIEQNIKQSVDKSNEINQIKNNDYIADQGGTIQMDINMNINVNINIFNSIKNFRKKINEKIIPIYKYKNTQFFHNKSINTFKIEPHKEIYLSADKKWGWFVDIESPNFYNK